MATISTCWARNQSSKANRSLVIVEKVRVYSSTLPSGWVIMMVVTAVFLCRSIPAHRSYSTCISSPLGGQSNERCEIRTSFLRVLFLCRRRHSSLLGAPVSAFSTCSSHHQEQRPRSLVSSILSHYHPRL